MGSPREMVSDLLYAVVFAFARGETGKVDALLALWEARYADGRSGPPLVTPDRGAASCVAAVAEQIGVHHATLRRWDEEFRAVLAYLVEGGFVDAEKLVRSKEGA